MPRWFVYVDIDYYPSGQFVEADTLEHAIAAAVRETNSGNDDWAAIAVPAEHVTLAAGDGADWRLQQLGAPESEIVPYGL